MSTPIPTVILLALLACCLAVDCDFDKYISEFNKTYAAYSTEYHYRQAIFAKNCQWVNANNNDPNSTYTLQLTKCTDLTEKERQKQLNLNFVDLSSLKSTSTSKKTNSQTVSSPPVVSATPPSSLNYNTLGYVTSIKNQGSCGCCWAFSSIATYESWLLMKGYNLGLSEQASLECTYLYAVGKRPSNCTAGYITDAMDYLALVGGVLRSNYPYTAGSISSGFPPSTPGICTETNRIYLGNGTTKLYETLTTAQLKQLLTDSGPLMVGIYADTGFSAYSTGIYSGCPSNASLYINHAVELIGYDSSNNWIIKNQWGTGWGESGFMTVSNSRDCGLSTVVIGIDFTSSTPNPSMTFDPTVYFWKASEEYMILAVIGLLIFL